MKKLLRTIISLIILSMVMACSLVPVTPTTTRETPRQENRQTTPTPTKTVPVSSVSITLGTPQQIFHRGQPDAMGMWNVPDMHTAVLQQPDESYLLWITGDIGTRGLGSVAMLSTNDFLTYKNAGPGTPTKAEPVFHPSCRSEDEAPSCKQNYDADYVGANSVITAKNGKDLLMFYEAGNRTSESNPTNEDSGGWEYNVMALARSADNGLTWRRQGVVLSGRDPKPASKPGTGQPGISEPGAIVVNGFIYMVYQYIPNQDSEPEAPSVIEVARAPVASDGMPGSWTKYYNGSFGSQPGLGGLGSPVVTTGKGTGCTRPVQVWPVYSTYLDAYVLLFLANEGWFFSTSTDLVKWTPPAQFLDMTMWREDQPMDWNYILVTPGNPGDVIDRTGYVLYASASSRKESGGGHELWVRPFTFNKSPMR